MTNIFPFHTDIAVRGYEIDAWGHVNNAVYLHWLEHGRWQMAEQGGFAQFDSDVLTVIRHVELDFRAETLFGDLLRLTFWPRRVGNTSFTLGASLHVLQANNPQRVGILAFLSTQVLTCIHRPEGKVPVKVPVPEAWRHHFPAVDPGPMPFDEPSKTS